MPAKPTTIYAGGQPVGAVFPTGESYRFVAVKYGVWDLDSQEFDSPDAATEAAVIAVAELGVEGHGPRVSVN